LISAISYEHGEGLVDVRSVAPYSDGKSRDDDN